MKFCSYVTKDLYQAPKNQISVAETSISLEILPTPLPLILKAMHSNHFPFTIGSIFWSGERGYKQGTRLENSNIFKGRVGGLIALCKEYILLITSFWVAPSLNVAYSVCNYALFTGQSKLCHHPPPPTTIHHHPRPVKIYHHHPPPFITTY